MNGATQRAEHIITKCLALDASLIPPHVIGEVAAELESYGDERARGHNCPKCGKRSNLYPAQVKARDYKCIDCTRAKQKERLRRLRKQKSPTLLARDIRNAKIQRVRNPEKVKARIIVARAIKSGMIVKPINCGTCLSTGRIEGHHFNGYSNPLDVKWLCVPCHRNVHRALAKGEGEGK